MKIFLSNLKKIICIVLLATFYIAISYINIFSTNFNFIKKLKLDYLEKLHQDILSLQNEKIKVTPYKNYQDIKAVLHAHSNLSHDSKGTPQEIAAALKKVGVKVIFMSEHPQSVLDVIANGLNGIIDDVLFFPGIESNNFLIYPTNKKMPDTSLSQQEIINNITKDGGLIFVSHPEEQKDWSLKNLTGMEIYNTHADLLDELPADEGFSAILAPSKLKPILKAFPKYPQEAFASIFDEPTGNLKNFDTLNLTQHIVGIAANDSHQNVKVLNVQIDAYEISFGYVHTHILVKEFTPENIWQSLKQGNVYVAFDWMVDATGFTFYTQDKNKTATMGEDIKLSKNLNLICKVPLKNTTIKLIHNGNIIKEFNDSELKFKVTDKGFYRVEVLVNLKNTGEKKVWIYSNPIYVK